MGISFDQYKNIEKDILVKKNVTPYQMSIGITPRCNSRCEYCNNWKDKNSKVNDENYILKIVKDAKKLGVTHILLSGGEPLLHNSIYSIIRNITNLGLSVLLITNGLLLTEDIVSELENSNCVKLGVSLDTIVSSTYEEIRGVSNKMVLENLDNIKKNHPNIAISICATVHKLNIKELYLLKEYCLKNKFGLQFQPIDTTNMSREMQIKYLPTDKEIEVLEDFIHMIIKEKKDGDKINNDIKYLQNLCYYFKNKKFTVKKCFAPYTQITINQKMELITCWGGIPIGSLYESSLADLWKTNLFDEYRKKAISGSCNGCYYSCHLSKPYTQF